MAQNIYRSNNPAAVFAIANDRQRAYYKAFIANAEVARRKLEAKQEYKRNLEDWKKQNPNEILLTDKSGKIIGVESGMLGKSLTYEQYKAEMERINREAPIPIYRNVITGDMVSATSPPSPLYAPAYATTKGEFIENIDRYMKEHNLPISPEKINRYKDILAGKKLETSYYERTTKQPPQPYTTKISRTISRLSDIYYKTYPYRELGFQFNKPKIVGISQSPFTITTTGVYKKIGKGKYITAGQVIDKVYSFHLSEGQRKGLLLGLPNYAAAGLVSLAPRTIEGVIGTYYGLKYVPKVFNVLPKIAQTGINVSLATTGTYSYITGKSLITGGKRSRAAAVITAGVGYVGIIGNVIKWYNTPITRTRLKTDASFKFRGETIKYSRDYGLIQPKPTFVGRFFRPTITYARPKALNIAKTSIYTGQGKTAVKFRITATRPAARYSIQRGWQKIFFSPTYKVLGKPSTYYIDFIGMGKGKKVLGVFTEIKVGKKPMTGKFGILKGKELETENKAITKEDKALIKELLRKTWSKNPLISSIKPSAIKRGQLTNVNLFKYNRKTGKITIPKMKIKDVELAYFQEKIKTKEVLVTQFGKGQYKDFIFREKRRLEIPKEVPGRTELYGEIYGKPKTGTGAGRITKITDYTTIFETAPKRSVGIEPSKILKVIRKPLKIIPKTKAAETAGTSKLKAIMDKIAVKQVQIQKPDLSRAISDIQMQSIQTIPKSTATLKIPQIKTKTAVGLLLNQKIRQSQRQTQKAMQKSMVKQVMATMPKMDMLQKQTQKSQQKQAQRLKSALKLSLGMKVPMPPVTVILKTPPTIPPVKPIPGPAFFIFDRIGTGKKKPKKKESKTSIYADFPDFTARMLNLPREKISTSDIEKRIRSIKTGLEIRRGFRL